MCHAGISYGITLGPDSPMGSGLDTNNAVFLCGECRTRIVAVPSLSRNNNGLTERAALRARLMIHPPTPAGDTRLADGATFVNLPAGYVAGHGYKPAPHFRITPTEAKHLGQPPVCRVPQGEMPFFGFEIEMEAPNTVQGDRFWEAARSFWNDPSGSYIVKSDGSINYGFEVVSQPGSLEYWRNHSFATFKARADQGFRSYCTSTCGMHVHVSRDILSPLTITKMLFFMRENQPFILAVSRRRPENLRQWAAPDCDSTRTMILKARDASGGWNRYTALNCCNQKTVEFRLFRGTLHGPAIVRNLEFVQSLISFADDHPLRMMTAKSYIEWLAVTTTIPSEARKSLLEWLKPMVRSNSRREISGKLRLRDDSAVIRLPDVTTDAPGVMAGEEGATPAAAVAIIDNSGADQPDADYSYEDHPEEDDG
jgi:hypothetical protein